MAAVGFPTLARVYAPFVVLPAALLWLAWAGFRPRRMADSPLALLAVYGLIGMVAGLAWSPWLEYAQYWATAYLATVGVCLAASRSSGAVTKATALLLATWVATATVAAGVTVKGSGTIFGDAPTAYGIINDLEGASRASGVGRWAGVSALVAIVWAMHLGSRIARAVLLAGAGVGLYVVYRVQSRGAVFAAAAGLLFLLCLDKQRRRWALPSLVIAVFFMAAFDAGGMLPEKILNYLNRGGSEESLYTLGGRTNYYREGWEAFKKDPFFGRGFWADRLTGIGHIHDGPLEALLTAGLAGFVAYLWAWIAGWRLFARLWRRRRRLLKAQVRELAACGAVLTFFTLRAIPEITGAGYEPDLLILCAAYAYLEAVHARGPGMRERAAVLTRRPGAQVSPASA